MRVSSVSVLYWLLLRTTGLSTSARVSFSFHACVITQSWRIVETLLIWLHSRVSIMVDCPVFPHPLDTKITTTFSLLVYTPLDGFVRCPKGASRQEGSHRVCFTCSSAHTESAHRSEYNCQKDSCAWNLDFSFAWYRLIGHNHVWKAGNPKECPIEPHDRRTNVGLQIVWDRNRR
jgi:hypothetical protein